MAMTKEQRSTYKLCAAKKKNGEKCRNFAGEGTDHLGIGTCKFHLGNTKAHKIHAERTEAQQRMAWGGEAIQMHPNEALLQMLYLSAGYVAFLRQAIGPAEDLESNKTVYLVRLYGEERDRVAKVAKACLDAGVAERQIRLAEQYAYSIAQYTEGLLDGLRLTAAQRSEHLKSCAANSTHSKAGIEKLCP